jgi:predicted RNA-binding protein Jag
MSASERRIVHLALAEHSSVKTFSEGEGGWRRVIVQPKVAGA